MVFPSGVMWYRYRETMFARFVTAILDSLFKKQFMFWRVPDIYY